MPCKQSGFTLLELMVAFSVAAFLMAVSTPMVMRMYDSMKYRGAVKDMVTAVEATRYAAITQGKAVDIVMTPAENMFQVGSGEERFLPDSISFSLEAAREVSHGAGTGAIRYYPDGSSTGGSIMITHDSGRGVRLRVDWLLGRLTQEPYDPS